MNNKSFCKHKEFRFAFNYTTAGILKPVYHNVFYCIYCKKLFIEDLKKY